VRESVNVTADEAVRLGVVDLVAEDVPALLNAVDGREVKLAHGTKTLHTAGAGLSGFDMGVLERFLFLISDPNIAYVLLTVGVYGLIYELANPGAILPGVAGVFALVLAFYSLGTLPINYAGLALILFGFALFIAELLIAPGVGALAVGGAVSLVLGSLLLLNGAPAYMALSPWVIGGVVTATVLFFGVALRAIIRSTRRAPATGASALVGAPGVARTDLAPDGMVFVAGELWRARASDGEIPEGATVVVTQVDGLTLTVRRT
jgi:membrane-bound serine protease (ClpP class)